MWSSPAHHHCQTVPLPPLNHPPYPTTVTPHDLSAALHRIYSSSASFSHITAPATNQRLMASVHLGIQLAEVSTMPKEIIEEAKRLSGKISAQRKVPWSFSFLHVVSLVWCSMHRNALYMVRRKCTHAFSFLWVVGLSSLFCRLHVCCNRKQEPRVEKFWKKRLCSNWPKGWHKRLRILVWILRVCAVIWAAWSSSTSKIWNLPHCPAINADFSLKLFVQFCIDQSEWQRRRTDTRINSHLGCESEVYFCSSLSGQQVFLRILFSYLSSSQWRALAGG